MLSEQEVRTFRRDGFLGPFDLADRDLAETVLTEAVHDLGFTEAVADLHPRHILGRHKGAPLVRANAHLTSEAVMRLGRDPAILRRLACLMGPDIYLRRSQFWRKPPQARGVIWHQDIHRKLGLGDIGELSAWVALEDATIDNGCVWLSRGSHVQGAVEASSVVSPGFRIRFFASDKVEIPEPLLGYEAAPMEVRKGQFFLFHQLCFHASGPNRSDGARTGVALRYLSDPDIPSVTEQLTQVWPEAA